MKALPETFDMAKRIGVMVWICNCLDNEKKFHDLFSIFQINRKNLAKQLNFSVSSKPGFNKWASKKLDIGLPNKNSSSSFSKYVRVGYGWNLYSIKGEKMNWLLEPNWLTKVINILTTKDCNSFVLNAEIKLCMTIQLLKVDDTFIVPLIRTLFKHNLSSDRWVKNYDFDVMFARNMIEFLETGFECGLVEEKAQTFLNRIRFFENNLDLLLNGNPPTRGFLHMIEPRIHWLLDLNLIDQNKFENYGIITPARCWESLNFDIKSLEDFQKVKNDIFTKYVEINSPCQEEPKKEIAYFFRKTIDDAINILSESYSSMIPIEAILRLSMTKLAAKFGKFFTQDEMIGFMENEYITYRDWRSGLGFIDARSPKKTL